MSPRVSVYLLNQNLRRIQEDDIFFLPSVLHTPTQSIRLYTAQEWYLEGKRDTLSFVPIVDSHSSRTSTTSKLLWGISSFVTPSDFYSDFTPLHFLVVLYGSLVNSNRLSSMLLWSIVPSDERSVNRSSEPHPSFIPEVVSIMTLFTEFTRSPRSCKTCKEL